VVRVVRAVLRGVVGVMGAVRIVGTEKRFWDRDY